MASRLAAMYQDLIAFAVICIAAGISGWVLACKTRGITFVAADSDNEKQVRAASCFGQWRWPSEMHKYGGGKTRTKDVFVLGLVMCRRLLGDGTESDQTVRLCIIVNSISAVLVFLVARSYWDVNTALLVFALFVTSIWPYLVVLYGGHICLGQMFFLTSVYTMQLAESDLWRSGLVLYLISGIAVGLMMFSSASSRKYLPLVIGASLYSQRDALAVFAEGILAGLPHFEGVRLAVVWGGMAVLLATGLTALTYRQLVKAMYFERGPAWLNRTLAGRERLSLDHYLRRAEEITGRLMKYSLALVLYLTACLVFFRPAYFYYSQLSLFLGVCLVAVLFTYPNITESLRGYFAYWDLPKYHGHYKFYKRHFASLGLSVPDDMRGEGVRWVVRFFSRIAPFHLTYYLLSLGLLGYLLVHDGLQRGDIAKSLGLILLSLSPVLVGEVTRGPQVGRSYYPAFAGLLLLTGHVASWAGESLTVEGRAVFWTAASVAVVAGVTWDMRVLLDDVWPARMAPAWLARTLAGRGIDKFYTYDTHYNDAFVRVMPKKVLDQVQIRFINSLRDVEEGYLVVPGTSAKALNMESQPEAIEEGDFSRDPILNRLIDSREVERYAVATFKTFGTSRMWIHESDVGSYRDLIIGEIGEYDRWRGRAWILDVGKLRSGGVVDELGSNRDRESRAQFRKAGGCNPS